jgi:hypothetical protein
MKPEERISYLVDTLEGGNAKRFSEKTGICPQSVSALRHGKYGIGRFVQRIADAYPEVSVRWLKTGEGEPTKHKAEKSRLEAKIDTLAKEVMRLSKMIEKMSQNG